MNEQGTKNDHSASAAPTQVTIVHRPFLDLFTDAIRMAGLALEKGVPPDLRNCAAKSSVLHSVFALEAAANSCVALMTYSSRLLDAVDRWQPLEKYEFVAVLFKPDARLDRGLSPVQEVRELLKIRNDYVHPRVREVPTEYSVAQSSFDIPGRSSEILEIPEQTNFWVYQHAKSALSASCSFYKYFFSQLCGLEPGETTSMLIDGLVLGEHIRPMIPLDHRDILQKARESMGLDISFLSIDDISGDALDFTYGGERLVSVYDRPAGATSESKPGVSDHPV